MSGMLLVYALYWFFALLHGWAMISCSDCLLGRHEFESRIKLRVLPDRYIALLWD